MNIHISGLRRWRLLVAGWCLQGQSNSLSDFGGKIRRPAVQTNSTDAVGGYMDGQMDE